MRQTLTLITLAGLTLWTGAELVGNRPHDPHKRGQNQSTSDATRASHAEVSTLPAAHPDIIQAPLAVCFAPGTPEDVMARVNAAIFPPVPDGSRYFVGNSWTAIGQPKTLTWSLVPDVRPVSAAANHTTGQIRTRPRDECSPWAVGLGR